jgi:hypothetical protein
MSKFRFFKTLLLLAVFSLAFTISYADSPQAPVKKKIVNTTTSMKAIGSDDGIIINYSVADGTTNAFIVVSDMMGNKVKVVRLTEGKGRISISKDVLDKYASSGMYNCSIMINGSKISSQPVKLINF